ncbi:hypothetical protein CCP3SC1_70036 [Gammaproteobacteria bacterium]
MTTPASSTPTAPTTLHPETAIRFVRKDGDVIVRSNLIEAVSSLFSIGSDDNAEFVLAVVAIKCDVLNGAAVNYGPIEDMSVILSFYAPSPLAHGETS